MYEKHFPSDPTLYKEKDKVTFLTDKKVDAELYGILMEYSYGDKELKETIIYKSSLPTQQKMCEMLNIGSRNTYKKHLNYLIEQEYLIDKGLYYIVNKKKENIYLKIDTDTIRFLNNTVKEPVWKAYIYLGQRWNWKHQDFIFDLEDLGKHIGKKINNHSKIYMELNDILQCLENNGLIKVIEFYDGKYRKKRLVEFNYHHNKTIEGSKSASQ